MRVSNAQWLWAWWEGESIPHTVTFDWWEVRMSHTQWLFFEERWECPTHSDFCLERGESVPDTVTFTWWEVRVSHILWLLHGERRECPTHSDFCLMSGESVPHTVIFTWREARVSHVQWLLFGERWMCPTLVWWQCPTQNDNSSRITFNPCLVALTSGCNRFSHCCNSPWN